MLSLRKKCAYFIFNVFYFFILNVRNSWLFNLPGQPAARAIYPAGVSFLSFLSLVILITSYVRMCLTDLHIFRTGRCIGGDDQSDILLQPLKGRCYGNQF